MEGIFEMEGLIEDVAFDFDDLGLGCLDWIDLGVFAVETTEDWKFSILFFLFCQIPMHDPAAAEDTNTASAFPLYPNFDCLFQLRFGG